MNGDNIRNIPTRDLITIDKLWLAASRGKYGFSVQKQLWINLAGKNSGELRGENLWNIFQRFIEIVNWEEDRDIVLDQRAVKGHLPLGLYATVDNGHKYQEWRTKISAAEAKISAAEAEEKESIKAELAELREKLRLVESSRAGGGVWEKFRSLFRYIKVGGGGGLGVGLGFSFDIEGALVDWGEVEDSYLYLYLLERDFCCEA